MEKLVLVHRYEVPIGQSAVRCEGAAWFQRRLASISHRLGVGMSADAANTSVCATASNAGCRISAWRTHSCVPRPHSCGRLCLKCDEKSRLRFSGRPTCSLSRYIVDSSVTLSYLMQVLNQR